MTKYFQNIETKSGDWLVTNPHIEGRNQILNILFFCAVKISGSESLRKKLCYKHQKCASKGFF